MKLRAMSILALMAATFAAPGAQAETATTATPYAVARAGASCAASQYPKASAALFRATTPGSRKAARSDLAQLKNCNLYFFSNGKGELVPLAISLPEIDGMLAEALLRADGDKPAGLEPLPLQAKYERDWYPATGRPAVLDEMSVCLAAVAPTKVLAIFDTRPDSTEERAAFHAIVPDIGKCLQTGYQLNGDLPSMRSEFAEAMYHRIHTGTGQFGEGSAH